MKALSRWTPAPRDVTLVEEYVDERGRLEADGDGPPATRRGS